MTEARPGAEAGHRRVDALSHQQVGDGSGGRRGQRDRATPRPHGGQDVLDGGGAQQPDRPGGWLLERLEQGVGGLVGQPVGLLDEDDGPAAVEGTLLRDRHQPAYVTHAERQGLGLDDADVPVGALEDRAAGVAVTTPEVGALALQGGGEGQGRVAATRTRWSGDQPGVRHGWAGTARDDLAGSGGCGLEATSRSALPDEGVPHAHEGDATRRR